VVRHRINRCTNKLESKDNHHTIPAIFVIILAYIA